MDWFSLHDLHRSDDGQYMVEFALSFVIFTIFILYVIDLGLLIYNHNLFYHGIAEAAREASIGASNDEIQQTVEDYIVDRYFPTALMVAQPDTGLVIEPQNEIERVHGTEVTVRMPTTFGFSILGFGNMLLSVPIQSSEVITVQNDEDRDGCKDPLEASGTSCNGYMSFSSTAPNDHRNSGNTDQIYFGGSESDADDDGADLYNDRVYIGYFQSPPSGGSTYAINRPNDSPLTPSGSTTFNWNGRTWETWFEGTYHAPVVWDEGTESVPKPFPRTLPEAQVDNSSETVTIRTLQGDYDRDNDGWEDKYDDQPTNPLQH
jgi:hypothetical protein